MSEFIYDAEKHRTETLAHMPEELRDAVLEPGSFLGSANYFARVCHLAALRFYIDRKTGSPKVMNVGERMALAMSEACEAQDGNETGGADDKLPDLPMLHVEVADFSIRILDNCGYCGWDIGHTIDLARRNRLNVLGSSYSIESSLFGMVRHMARAMEGDRKDRVTELIDEQGRPVGISTYRLQHALALLAADRVAVMLRLPLVDIIQRKMSFNAVRPDHQLQNRSKDDGLKY